MLLRISLIVAVLAGLAAAGLGYFEVSKQIPALTDQRNKEHDAKVVAQTDLAQTKTELGKTQSELTQTKQELGDTKAERDKAVARAETQSKRADELSDKLAKATQERDDAQTQLSAYKATDLTPDQVLKLGKNLKEAENQIAIITAEKQVLMRTRDRLTARLQLYEGPDVDVKLPAGLKGKIVVVDPKWDFVVINVGEENGVLEKGELLVSRSGKLVAKVIVRTVQKDRCVANVVAGWKLGELIEGDEISPAHPAPAS